MAGLSHFVTQIKSFNGTIIERAERIINDNPQQVVDLIKQQLLDGKNKDGSFLRSMSQDPYFKKPGAWQRYAAFKQDKFPSAVRPFDVPNLTVVNVYHNGIEVYASAGQINYPNSSSIAADVQASFPAEQTMGLTAENKVLYANEMLIPELRKELKVAIYG